MTSERCRHQLSIRNTKNQKPPKKNTNSLTKPLGPSSTRTVLSLIHTTSIFHDGLYVGLHVLVVKIVNLRLRLERLPLNVEDTLLTKDRSKMNGNWIWEACIFFSVTRPHLCNFLLFGRTCPKKTTWNQKYLVKNSRNDLSKLLIKMPSAFRMKILTRSFIWSLTY